MAPERALPILEAGAFAHECHSLGSRGTWPTKTRQSGTGSIHHQHPLEVVQFLRPGHGHRENMEKGPANGPFIDP